MNRTTTLRRKLIYLVILVAMLIPLYLLGQPAGGKGDLGGELSEMRIKYNIAESDLGEISPASETMKLASLGLRGVAATLLWNKAHEYRVKHEWDRLKATLNNIALLQPHFDKVWEHQAHNLAYNVSTEFDDYRQRYEMVREGTEFLTRGVRQNRNAPRLIWYTGWFYGSKMGMSDEKAQFRRLFSDDEVLHEQLLTENIAVDSPEARGPLGKPDNWLVGRLWLNRGYEMVDAGVKIRRQTPINFYETGPKWRIQHAEAIEKEGILDERAQNAWEMAAEDWSSFGNRSIPTTSPFTIK
ncbi:MAG: IRE (iron responsive element), partial [Rubripirellula sp.]